jgi:prepilin-type N-terminal cleavage/methylation domain-containing protein
MWTTNQGSGFSVQGSATKGRCAAGKVPGAVSARHPFAPSPVERSPFRTSPSTRAFTLTELLVVITIIGMLAAISATYLLKAWNTAKQSRTAAEVTNLASAVEEFRRTYGDYPPSYLDHSDLTARALMIRFLAKAFPRCDPNVEVWYIPWCGVSPQTTYYPYLDINGKLGLWDPGTSTNVPPAIPSGNPPPYAPMTPGQALVFWLTSISKDPAHPLSAPTADRQSFFDFDNSRITRLNSTASPTNSISGSAWTVVTPTNSPPPWQQGPTASSGSNYPKYNPGEYFPKDGNQREYVYFEARCYLFHALFKNGDYPRTPNPPIPYLSRSAPWNVDTTSSNLTAGPAGDVVTDNGLDILGAANDSSQSFTSFQKLCVNPKSFQIISAGLDNDFGTVNTAATRGTSPGVLALGASVNYVSNPPVNPSFPGQCLIFYKSYPDGQGYDTITNADDDNITNFSEGPLGNQKAQ